jgi:hypothetical protein
MPCFLEEIKRRSLRGVSWNCDGTSALLNIGRDFFTTNVCLVEAVMLSRSSRAGSLAFAPARAKILVSRTILIRGPSSEIFLAFRYADPENLEACEESRYVPGKAPVVEEAGQQPLRLHRLESPLF